VKDKKPTAGIVLAAGLSTRLGRLKQLIKLKGKPLLEWVVDVCLKSRLENIILVLGHNAQLIETALSDKLSSSRVHTVIHTRYDEGISHSLRTGLIEVKDGFPSVMFLLGDQPMVDSRLIDLLLTSFWKSEKDICVPTHKGRQRNPCIFSQKYYGQLLKLQGDIGARNIIKSNPDDVLSVEVDDPISFLDIDTEKDIDALKAIIDPMGKLRDL
jgi:molybdenum cofactor cytidylyltransferase